MTSQTVSSMQQLEWTFGDRLRKVRRVLKISQQELADTLGVNSASIAAWETGLNAPRNVVEVAKDIETNFGVPAAWMLGLQMPNAPQPGGPGGGGGAPLPRLDSNQQPFGYESMLLALNAA